MSEFVHVAVDAMGGDNAPSEIVKGSVNALNKCPNLKVTFTGKEELVKAELDKLTYPADRVQILNCTEVIAMAEPPVDAIRTKKDSSIVKGLRLVKDGECDAFVTAGSTGAALAGGQLLVGRIKGIERPPLAPLMPTAKGPVLLVDCGANMDPRPSMLLQFAQMGSIYMRNMTGIENPRVGLVNVGTEEEKGNELAKQAHQLLKNCPDINYRLSNLIVSITVNHRDRINSFTEKIQESAIYICNNTDIESAVRIRCKENKVTRFGNIVCCVCKDPVAGKKISPVTCVPVKSHVIDSGSVQYK